ncbi:hypothetical protein V865_007075 [Kwoniella europaea PYCC6329]|uniref:HORMA domain-containing protein n=1 Tax=Kwoniella europaea PYCC6329 TaxID=1423913 RepID=A0AAX4KR73_9TREE
MARGPPKQAFRPPASVQRATTSQQNASQSQGTTQKGKEKQVQNQDQTIVTKEDSFDILKVTLEANIGIICYLRNLLPEEDFEYFYICGSNAPPAKSPDELYRLTAEEARAWNAKQQAESQSQSQTQGVPDEVSDVRTFSWRKIKDDQSRQGKAICQLLSGAEEAMRKGYLRSLMLIIFLDEEDPTNVIETYTFNFFYHESTGAPSMSVEHSVNRELDQSLNGFALLDKNRMLGNPMTHLEVRRMVKVTAHSLVKVLHAMGELPKKRFVDIKLFYNDSAPENYVAPSFADSSKEVLVLGTNDVDNPPLWLPFQEFQTGHHGVSVSAVSVTDSLPEIPRRKATGPEDYAARYAEDDLVKANAEERDVLWTAHDRMAYEPSAPNVYTACIDPSKAVPQDPSGGLKQPIGRRQEDGTIAPIGSSQSGNGIERGRQKRRACEGARYIDEETLQMSQAMSELTPTRGSTRASSSVLSQANHRKSIEDSLFQQNSQSFTGNHSQVYLDSIDEIEVGHTDTQSPSLSTQRLAVALHQKVQLNKRKSSDDDDTDETQTQPRKPRALKSIVSTAMKNNGYEVKSTGKSRPKPKSQSRPKPKPKHKTTAKPKSKAAAKLRSRQASARTSVKAKKTSIGNGKNKIQSKDNDVIECYCGLNDEEGHMILCDGCDKWFHATCLGFIDGSSASQLTVNCITCEMRNDKKRHWPQEDIDKAEREMGALALLRQVMQELRTRGHLGKDELPEIQRQFGCERKDVDLVLRKLENEGLVEMLADDSDDSQSSNDWTWKWCKNANAVNRFVTYFQYGRGIEDELFAVRKWRKRPQINNDASQSIPGSQNGSFTESQSRRSRVHSSKDVNADSDKDADGEEDIEMSNDDPTTAGPSKASAAYELPFFRSSRAVRVVDCSDVWTEREEDMDEDGADDA